MYVVNDMEKELAVLSRRKWKGFILGQDMRKELIDERTGFNSYCVCLDCLEKFGLDI